MIRDDIAPDRHIHIRIHVKPPLRPLSHIVSAAAAVISKSADTRPESTCLDISEDATTTRASRMSGTGIT